MLKSNIIVSALLPHPRGLSAPTCAGDPARGGEAAGCFGPCSSPA